MRTILFLYVSIGVCFQDTFVFSQVSLHRESDGLAPTVQRRVEGCETRFVAAVVAVAGGLVGIRQGSRFDEIFRPKKGVDVD